MKISAISPLEKVLTQKNEYRVIDKITLLQNERGFFGVHFENDAITRFFFSIELEGGLKDFATIYKADEVPCTVTYQDVNLKDDYVISHERGLYPDPLKDIKAQKFSLARSVNCGFMVELFNDKGLPVGEHKLTIKAVHKGKVLDQTEITVEVLGVNLPENDLMITQWIHYDSIAKVHGEKPFDDEYMTVLKKYFQMAVDYGQNMVMIPLFTFPLDTEIGLERLTFQSVKVEKVGEEYKFDFTVTEKLIDLAFSCGFKYIEFSHLFTQWGAEKAPKVIATVLGKEERIFGWDTSSDGDDYRSFLGAFLTELVKFIDKKGIRNKCCFHVSDEPNETHIQLYSSHVKFLKQYIGDMPIMDALSNYEYYELGFVDLPVVTTRFAHNFVERCPNFMVYYCCCECVDNLSNRFLNMPLARARVLGVQLYNSGTKGFLHYGFNFYNSAFSIFDVDPYRNTDAGGFLPSGDPFVVYPDKDLVVIPSIRLFAMAQAFEDYRALKLLEKIKGKQFVLDFIASEGVIDFKTYPTTEGFVESFRDKVNELIKRSID